MSCIQYGHNATDPTEYPFFSAVFGPFSCGGTILSYDPAFVLSAAHCVEGGRHPKDIPRKDNYYHAQYGDIHLNNQTVNTIIDWFVHPKYHETSKANINFDSVILRLENPIKKSSTISRAALWTPAIDAHPTSGKNNSCMHIQKNMTDDFFFFLYTLARHVGFGNTEANKGMTPLMQVLDYRILHIDTEGKEEISVRAFNVTQSECHGDSGGPLFIRRNATDPSTNKTITDLPFVLGDLTRTINIGPKPDGCPVPPPSVGNFSRTTGAFTNVVASLDWIANVTGISKEHLIDPFWEAPCERCKNATTKQRYGVQDPEQWPLERVNNPYGLFNTEGLSL